ncbi:MAG: hypothetical protein ACREUQ_03260, partial [Burkholderiales bacterium]
RTAYAAAAQLRDDGAAPRASGDATHRTVRGDALHHTVQGEAEGTCEQAQESSAGAKTQGAARGEPSVITDGADFVDAIFSQVDPVEVSCRLLGSEDERVVEKHFERLLDIKFGKPSTGPLGEDGSPASAWDPDRE